LYGYGDSDSSIIKRGHRIFCSNRNNKNGCGKTFSILKSIFITNFIICADTVWNFLEKVGSGNTLAEAFRNTGSTMGKTTCYRIFKKFCFNQPRIRTRLLNTKSPPVLNCAKDPFIQTIHHLAAVFQNCPISEFQHHFQSSFL